LLLIRYHSLRRDLLEDFSHRPIDSEMSSLVLLLRVTWYEPPLLWFCVI